MERREFITGALAAFAAGSLLPPPRLWQFNVKVWLVSSFSLDQVPWRATLWAYSWEDAFGIVEQAFPHHEPGDMELPNSSWKASVRGDMDAPWRAEG